MGYASEMSAATRRRFLREVEAALRHGQLWTCEYGHWECSTVLAGTCSDEAAGLEALAQAEADPGSSRGGLTRLALLWYASQVGHPHHPDQGAPR